MATVAESPDSNPKSKPISDVASSIDNTPWIEYAVQQAQLLQNNIQHNLDSFIESSRSRLSQIRSTSSAHFAMTIDSVRDATSEYAAYEDIFFGKIKEGIDLAAARPMVTAGVITGLGFVLLQRPRRFLYYKTVRLLMSEESMLTRADSRVKELRKSVDLLKAESEKLEKSAQLAEEEMLRGRTKLRQAGKQIQSAIQSAYKIERRAAGLKDVLGELPHRESSRFKSQVSKLASEVKRERNALTKEVAKISNYGISV